MAEQLIRNEQVVGSIPTTSSKNNRGVQMGTYVVLDYFAYFPTGKGNDALSRKTHLNNSWHILQKFLKIP